EAAHWAILRAALGTGTGAIRKQGEQRQTVACRREAAAGDHALEWLRRRQAFETVGEMLQQAQVFGVWRDLARGVVGRRQARVDRGGHRIAVELAFGTVEQFVT